MLASKKECLHMVYCQNDPFQPRYPAISEVRYVGMRVGECGWVEKDR
jgi:hypothetical protein